MLTHAKLEWYFSEYNLPKDKWLKEETAWPSNGMILLEKLMNFNRMKQYSQEAVVEAVKNSTVLKYLANPDRVGRKEPLPLPDSIASKRKIGDLPSEELAAEATEYYGGRERIRSIYVKGFFPAEEAKLEEIETLFRPYGSQAVRMRRNRDNTFKGSVFVEFKDQEDRDNFMKLENKPVYKNNEMHYETKDGYCERKLMENPQFREQDNRSRGRGRGGFRGRGRGSGRGRGRGRGGNDYRNGRNSDRRSRSPNDRKKDEDWRARRDRDRANDRANDQAKHE